MQETAADVAADNMDGNPCKRMQMEKSANCTEEGYQEARKFKQRKKIDVRQSEKKNSHCHIAATVLWKGRAKKIPVPFEILLSRMVLLPF